MTLRNFTDAEFAEWLRGFGNWDYRLVVRNPRMGVTEFLAPSGLIVAVVVYDNQTCEHWVYTNY